MTSIAITSATLYNEDKFIRAIEQIERYNGKRIKEMALKNMILTVKEWKE